MAFKLETVDEVQTMSCPECGQMAESYTYQPFYVLSCEMYYGVPVPGTERHVHIPQGEPEFTLQPCGHQVYTITVKTRDVMK